MTPFMRDQLVRAGIELEFLESRKIRMRTIDSEARVTVEVVRISGAGFADLSVVYPPVFHKVIMLVNPRLTVCDVITGINFLATTRVTTKHQWGHIVVPKSHSSSDEENCWNLQMTSSEEELDKKIQRFWSAIRRGVMNTLRQVVSSSTSGAGPLATKIRNRMLSLRHQAWMRTISPLKTVFSRPRGLRARLHAKQSIVTLRK